MNQTRRQSTSPSHQNNTSTEARELLNQNKQDYVALKESPEKQKTMESFTSQQAAAEGLQKDQKFDEYFKLP